jgi:hypothetical protein
MTQPILPPLPYNSSKPAIRYVYRVNWGATLIIACLALGLSAGVIQLERAQIAQQRNRMAAVTAAASLRESQEEDLGKLLADPETRLVPFEADAAIGQATVAWNERLQQGAIFCDHLPISDSGQPYAVVAYDSPPGQPATDQPGSGHAGKDRTITGQSRQIATLQVRPGVSVYFFSSGSPIHLVRRIEVISSDNSPNGRPMLYANVAG